MGRKEEAMQTNGTPYHILALLAYSWSGIDYDYAYLTDAEKGHIDEEQFYALVEEIMDAGLMEEE